MIDIKSKDKYSVLREALDKVYSNKQLKESTVYNYIVRYDGGVEPLYITSVNPFDLGKKKDAYKFKSFNDAFNAWEELCKDPKFRDDIINDTDRTIFEIKTLKENKTDKDYINEAVKETLEWFKNSLEDGLFDAEEYEDDLLKPLDLEDILYQYTLDEATYDLPDDTKWAKDPDNYTTEEQEAFDEEVIKAALPKAKILWNRYSKVRDLVKFNK